MRILLVEDEEDLRFLLSTALAAHGHEVIEAASGEEALERAEADPDVVVLDVRLPGIDGFRTLERLGDAVPPRTIMMSAHGDAHLAARAEAAGCAAYLSKPFQLEELRSLVASVDATVR